MEVVSDQQVKLRVNVLPQFPIINHIVSSEIKGTLSLFIRFVMGSEGLIGSLLFVS